ncbi:hypothetical protein BCV71DRAFT_69578 [Rhizopus microsporus]|uniref:Uncharacterized protein n=1 Tax=Rhizopus microsporus TaxID=58291 RepID=A0A1X0RN39_RHIZD|nr:hypothetical protein BCV71DRAFT_69578 [Rhizopus microsporus]
MQNCLKENELFLSFVETPIIRFCKGTVLYVIVLFELVEIIICLITRSLRVVNHSRLLKQTYHL